MWALMAELMSEVHCDISMEPSFPYTLVEESISLHICI